MEACFSKGRQLGLDCLWLGVWEKNTKALAFYERVGFRKFGRHIFMLGNDRQEDFLLRYDL